MTQYIPHFFALLAGGLIACATGSYVFDSARGTAVGPVSIVTGTADGNPDYVPCNAG